MVDVQGVGHPHGGRAHERGGLWSTFRVWATLTVAGRMNVAAARAAEPRRRLLVEDADLFDGAVEQLGEVAAEGGQQVAVGDGLLGGQAVQGVGR